VAGDALDLAALGGGLAALLVDEHWRAPDNR